MTKKSKEVASWKSALAEDAIKTAEQERPASSFISLKGGCMTYQEEAVPGNMLECVVVASVTERVNFNRAYDPEDTDPPECFAQSVETDNHVPHANVLEPKHPTCRGCPSAEFGTALQGKGPACKTYRKLIVMPVDSLDKAEDAEIAVMRVPPTSVKNWSQYAAKIASSAGLPPWAVKTMITVKPHPKKQFEVSFTTTGQIEDESQLSAVHGRIEVAEQQLLSPYEYDTEAEPAAPAKDSKF